MPLWYALGSLPFALILSYVDLVIRPTQEPSRKEGKSFFVISENPKGSLN